MDTPNPVPRATPPTLARAGGTPPTAESPCIKVCQLDLEGRCRGCGRTVDEITRWRTMSTEERIAVNQRLGFVSHDRRPVRP